MKTRFKWLSVLAALLGCIITLFISSCNKDEPSENVRYTGRVVYLNTTTPFPDCLVQVTDGSNIHCQAYTDADGSFSLIVRVSEINGNYYFLAGDATCIPKKVALSGYGKSTVDLGTIEVEGPTLPTVTTKLGAITVNTAISGGEVTSDGRLSVTARGVCWSKSEFPTLEEEHTTNGEGKGEFQSKLSDLQANTTYYVRAYATNALGTAYGNQIQFTTQDGLPIIKTETTTATSTKIISGGTISSDGGYAITSRGVCYSTTNSTPTIEDNYTTAGIGTGTFSTIITNVSVSTTYYVRAYATNSIGTGYGTVMTVTTGNGLPSVTTTVIGENVTSNTAISGGQVTDDGGYTVTARGVCWNILPYPTIADDKTVNGSGTGYYSSTITGLDWTHNDIYYIRAYATNENGTSYGEQVTISKETYEYTILPAIEYGGYIYRLHPYIGSMTWDAANAACQNLIYGGYDDWELPETKELLEHLIWADEWDDKKIPKNCTTYSPNNRTVGYYWTAQQSSSNNSYICYLKTRKCGDDNTYYCVTFSESYSKTLSAAVRPVRKYRANQ